MRDRQNVEVSLLLPTGASSVGFGRTPINHPVHRLPPELLSCVFWHAIPPKPLSKLSEAPFSVSATCKSWRVLALSTPALWAQISIGAACYPVAIRPTHLEVLDQWVSRSGTLPLSITLKLLCEGWGIADGSRDLFERVAQTIISCQHRWESLSLHLPINCLRTILESGGVAPRLRELTVEESEFYLLSTAYVEFHLERFPVLERVDFFGCSSRVKAPRMPVPCTRMVHNRNLVTRLRFARVGLAQQPFELLSVLAHSPCLEDLQVDLCISPEDLGIGPTWKGLIQLPRLRKLWLQFLAVDIGRYTSGLFLDHLCTPSLAELTIADSSAPCPDLLEGFPDFFERSRAPTQLFCFEKFVGNADRPRFIDVLRLLPSLKELRLHMNTFLNVGVLMALDRTSGLLPLLEVVSLDAPNGFVIPRMELRTDVFTPLLTTMVNSRRSDRSHFFQRINFNGRRFEDIDEFLNELSVQERVSDSWRAFPLLDPDL